MPQRLMQPFERLNHAPDPVGIISRAHLRDHLLHLLLRKVWKPLNQLAIHEAERLRRLSHLILERPVAGWLAQSESRVGGWAPSAAGVAGPGGGGTAG